MRDKIRKTTGLKVSEHDVQRAIMDYLCAKGIFRERRNIGTKSGQHKGKKWFVRFSTRGSADIFGALPPTGKHFEIEVKAPGWKAPQYYHTRTGKINQAYVHWQEQVAFGVEVAKAGVIWFVAQSLEDVKRELGV